MQIFNVLVRPHGLFIPYSSDLYHHSLYIGYFSKSIEYLNALDTSSMRNDYKDSRGEIKWESDPRTRKKYRT